MNPSKYSARIAELKKLGGLGEAGLVPGQGVRVDIQSLVSERMPHQVTRHILSKY